MEKINLLTVQSNLVNIINIKALFLKTIQMINLKGNLLYYPVIVMSFNEPLIGTGTRYF